MVNGKPKKRIVAVAIVVAALCSAGTLRAQDYKIGYITDLSGPLAGSYTPTWEGLISI